MTPEFIISFAKDAIFITLLISMPILMVGLVVGLIVSIFQTVTSIQEQTLTIVPKIVAVFLSILFLAPWLLEKLTTYTTKILTNIPTYIR
ncbi:MAG: flagellar biosynthesis protein FliQ [Desulfobacterales bacterium]|nr:flagellar biosynthesis protein FliQ [Desulfobacterales bacterium]MBF0396176.1 flagellar biosynthesis protein FliQ [Desulfobacterales bacterium]